MNSRVPSYVGQLAIYIHFLDELVAMLATWPSCSDEWHAAHDRAYKLIGRLRNVNEICFDHQCWVSLHPTAKTWHGVASETGATHAKILRILTRMKNNS
jgi:hypothetical protein